MLMPYPLVIILLLGLGALPLKAATLKGRIVENELPGSGLANVEILDEAQTTNPTTSDGWGRFSLEFPTKHAVDPVRIIVKREGYAVVNSEFLDLRGCLKSPDFVIFHRLCSPFQLPSSWGKRWSAYRES